MLCKSPRPGHCSDQRKGCSQKDDKTRSRGRRWRPESARRFSYFLHVVLLHLLMHRFMAAGAESCVYCRRHQRRHCIITGSSGIIIIIIIIGTGRSQHDLTAASTIAVLPATRLPLPVAALT